MNASVIVTSFIKRYAEFWRNGAQDVQSVYTPDAILCGYEIVRSREEIKALLGGVYGQGFTEIEIDPVQISFSSNTILIACLYRAKRGEESLTAKSSYVLIECEGAWKIAMHTAT
ncbi:hypothetical protein [Burkholderia gladioli]|uniref:hypothetical protein n=1 Tax=Burkholderia gladioli TaxID=28095 RepID=UPI00163FC1E2|nr:hypothetical protein [Burkholderia gladioli]